MYSDLIDKKYTKKIGVSMGELIVYENDMNKLKFGNFTKVSMNFFMALCYFIKNKGNTHFVISFDELRKKANYTQTEQKDFMRDLDYMTDQMLEVNSTIIEKKPSGKKRICKFDLFPTFIIDEETETLEVAVNDRFTWLFNEFEHYTSIDLEEIVSFKSKYTKNLFRLIRQWKSKGELRISGTDNIQEFREKIGVKDTYSNAEMNRRCLAPSVQEINDSNCSIQNLKYELEYASKRGQPLKTIIFSWDKVMEESTKKIADITTESVYYTIKEVLKDKPEFKEEDIISIAKAAKKNDITDVQVKQRIGYALHQENIMNPVGYIIALMQKFNSTVEIRNKFNKFNDFQQNSYDFDELEKMLLQSTYNRLKPEITYTEEPVEKLTDFVKEENSHYGKDETMHDYITEEGFVEVENKSDPNIEIIKNILNKMKQN